jgi:hypothetical protein
MLLLIVLALTCVTLLPAGYYFARHMVASWRAWQEHGRRGHVVGKSMQRGSILIMMVVAIFAGSLRLSDSPIESLQVETLVDPAASAGSLTMDQVSLLPEASWRAVDPFTLRMYVLKETAFWFRIPVPTTTAPVAYTAEVHFAMLGLVDFAVVSDGHIVERATFGTDSGAATSQWTPLFPMLSFYTRPGLGMAAG